MNYKDNNYNLHEIDPHRYDLENTNNIYLDNIYSFEHYHTFNIVTDNTYEHNHILNGQTLKTILKGNGHIHTFQLNIETQNGFHKVVGETDLSINAKSEHRHFIKGLTEVDKNHIHFFEGYTSHNIEIKK